MKRKYYRRCGNCGERLEQSEMVRTELAENGWLCKECYEEAVKNEDETYLFTDSDALGQD